MQAANAARLPARLWHDLSAAVCAVAYMLSSLLILVSNAPSALPPFLPGSKTKDGVCPITSGQQTVDMLGLGELTIGENFAVLAAYILICRIVAYLGIRFIKH